MSVTARFFVAETTRYAYNADATKVILSPATRGEENKQWAAATPSGRIEMTINNGAASDQFVPKAEFLITFERVDQA